MKFIHVEIKKNGKILIWVSGAKGRECLSLTEDFEKALGEIESKELTSDYYAEEKQTEEEKQKIKHHDT